MRYYIHQLFVIMEIFRTASKLNPKSEFCLQIEDKTTSLIYNLYNLLLLWKPLPIKVILKIKKNMNH